MLCAIGILEHTVKKHGGKNTTEDSSNRDENTQEKPNRFKSTEKIISSKALLLSLKACYGYLKSKDHLDIDGDVQGEVWRVFHTFLLYPV